MSGLSPVSQPGFVVVSGSSGSGKTTLCRMVSERLGFYYVVSHTTRPKRDKEVDGVDYFFLNKDEFEKMKANGEFLEWAEVYGNYYGTSKKLIDDHLAQGCGVIHDVDTQGALSIKKVCEQAHLVFIDVPSLDELKTRLVNRGTDSMEVIEKRLLNAQKEMQYRSQYHSVIMNDDIDKAYQELATIISRIHA